MVGCCARQGPHLPPPRRCRRPFFFIDVLRWRNSAIRLVIRCRCRQQVLLWRQPSVLNQRGFFAPSREANLPCSKSETPTLLRSGGSITIYRSSAGWFLVIMGPAVLSFDFVVVVDDFWGAALTHHSLGLKEYILHTRSKLNFLASVNALADI